ncbi:FkbM family methyltransferase [Pelagibacteraceae bacterium]|nr:FkbM family methyltransferase [Pelagibacteraceae bacterium]
MFVKLKKKIHILQNIYLKNKYLFHRDTYAMDGEDTAIIKYVDGKSDGFYLDIGAHHPIQRNNTHLLHRRGWSGINIDVNEFSIDLFNFLRPKDLNIQTAISDKNGEITFYYQKDFSQLNTTDIEIAKEHFNNNFKQRSVKCQSIENILYNSKFKDKTIDFLNIDIEGAEMKVLSTLNFKKYDPKVICIEILGYRELDPSQREIKIKNDEIYQFLFDKNYKKVWSGSAYCSHLFIKN